MDSAGYDYYRRVRRLFERLSRGPVDFVLAKTVALFARTGLRFGLRGFDGFAAAGLVTGVGGLIGPMSIPNSSARLSSARTFAVVGAFDIFVRLEPAPAISSC
jgi:hypothetical protein